MVLSRTRRFQAALNFGLTALERDLLKILRFSAVSVEELENPRPHYSVKVHGAVTSTVGASDPAAGLLPEEVMMTVRLSTDVGSDLVAIRKAACQRALALLETLTSTDDDIPEAAQPAIARADTVDAGA